jgi:hypothetical protein
MRSCLREKVSLRELERREGRHAFRFRVFVGEENESRDTVSAKRKIPVRRSK